MTNVSSRIPSLEHKASLETFNKDLEAIDVKLMPALNMTVSKEEYVINLDSVLKELECAILDENKNTILDSDQLHENFKSMYKSSEMI